MNGTIFDIKEFSIHDGPGARVTIFLKGCPLRCKWCHNPEGLSSKIQLMYKKNMCTHCGKCLQPCDHPECEPFDRCIHACANGCLSLSGKAASPSELADKMTGYRDFFQMTGGGVTISGGEPMVQADFVLEFIKELKHRMPEVHTALQTSGYADYETYCQMIDGFDFIMQDLKLGDCKEHLTYTGVSNDKILKNAEYLKKSGKPFVFRIPLIPGITDTDHNLKLLSQIAEYYPVELLKYNTLAGAKYEMLDMQYPLTEGISIINDDVSDNAYSKNKEASPASYFKNAKWG